MAVSPEEKSFVYSKNYGNTSSLLLVKIDGEDVLATPESDQQFTQSDPVYISEQEIYFITNYESDFSYLAKFDLQKREFSKVLELKGSLIFSISIYKRR
ncbi:hypothetical protein [Bacillus sp. V2I10]|uniref:hypothetical protein n=1 Tax=Bacillus sp. V2I10 TaxID=3042276 RepID=UPI0027880278|nr:hypothetical protein [Bacillus sp. V2I10]MDQ0859182.1 hypothetical protein [Bacillus sp. V2I10]